MWHVVMLLEVRRRTGSCCYGMAVVVVVLVAGRRRWWQGGRGGGGRGVGVWGKGALETPRRWRARQDIVITFSWAVLFPFVHLEGTIVVQVHHHGLCGCVCCVVSVCVGGERKASDENENRSDVMKREVWWIVIGRKQGAMQEHCDAGGCLGLADACVSCLYCVCAVCVW